MRAVSSEAEKVGSRRYPLYANAWQRVNEAEAAGYYLEAITLIESLLADRMESRASYLLGKNVGFQVLGTLIKMFRENEKRDDFREVISRIDEWRVHRNQAVHELVKFEAGEHTSWSLKTAGLPGVCAEGKKVLLRFNALDIEDRKRHSAGLAGTEPDAFGLAASSSHEQTDVDPSQPGG